MTADQQHAPDPSPSTGAATTSRGRMALWIGGAVVVAVLAWVAWSLLGPAPDAVDIDAAVAAVDDESGDPITAATATSTPAPDATATGGDDPADPADPADQESAEASADGTWTVDTTIEEFSIDETTGTFVGFRIDEELSSVGATTAIGRTPVVTGTVTIAGQELTAATVTGDLTAIESDESRRENAIQRALGTDTNPAATFVLTEPADLGTTPAVGTPIEIDATGELTVNGVTQVVTMPLAAVWTGDVVVVTGSLEVALSDHDVDAPTAPIVVSVADDATVEVQLYLSR